MSKQGNKVTGASAEIIEDMEKTDAQEREFPRVRPIDAIPVPIMDKTMFLVRDPARISPKSLMLTAKTFFLVSMFDGKTSMRDIQLAYSRKFGNLIFTDQVMDVIFELDCALLMHNKRFLQYLDFLKDEFKNRTVRECIMSGDDYPKDPEELTKMLDELYEKLEGDPADGEPPIGVAAPHIDFARGGSIYARSYRQVKKMDCDTFVVFGTSHNPVKNLVALTDKSFNTPLGEIPCDKDLVSSIARNSSRDFFAGEFSHRGEHSIEFQAVMLRHAFPDRDISIVPILVGSLDHLAREGRPPALEGTVRDFVEAFQKTVEHTDRKIGFIAGVDLSHTGTNFGDSRPPTPKEMESLKTWERQGLAKLEEGDPEGFFGRFISQQEEYRVCGLSALYLMGRVMQPFRGTVLAHSCCSDDEFHNNVSIASMSFHRQDCNIT